VHYTRIHAGPDGESHFEDSDIALNELPYAPPAPPFLVSDATPASAVAFTVLPAGWHGDWHPSPRLQWWFQLAGDLEVHTSDGDVRRLGPGAIVLVADTTGRGHTTTVVGPVPVLAVYVHIPDGA
jgi:quercetin dioxygenase-like cupin family protein